MLPASCARPLHPAPHAGPPPSLTHAGRTGQRGRRRARGPIAGVLSALLALLALGCQQHVHALPTRPDYMQIFDGRGATRVADIHVFREEAWIRLSNTTLETFGPGRLWINAQYSRPIDGLAINQSLELRLDEFVNRFGESFRSGGFFASKRPDELVLVEYEEFPPAATAADQDAPSPDGRAPLPASQLVGLVIVEDLY